MLRSVLQLFLFSWLLFAPSFQQEAQDYQFKAKNLKPFDFGVDESSWEKAISQMNKRLKNAPDDKDALLLRAVAHREMGIRRALLLRKIDWQKSTADFEEILAQDSTFSDALFQYGLLLQYKRNFDGAITLMKRQQELNGHEGYIEAALFRLHRYFIEDKPASDVNTWFDANPSDYSAYFKGELLRKKGEHDAAKTVFSELLTKKMDMPVQPVLLSLARINYASGNSEKAQDYIYQAIDSIQNEVDARMFFEDVKYILTDEEVVAFKNITKADAFRAFFKNLLAKRNPTRADDVDVRLEIHYNRLLKAESIYTQYAQREAFRVIKGTESYQTADRDFPEAYWLNGELGDRGLIYVRHGEPDDKASSVSDDTPFIESWRYFNPELVFHFEGHSGLGVLIPALPIDLDVLEAREVWGGPYALLSQTLRRRSVNAGTSLARSSDLDIISYNNEIFDKSLKDVTEGLSTDRFVWPDEFAHIDISYMVSSFRGDSNRTVIDVHYALPLGEVSEEIDRADPMVDFDVGFTVHDTLWNTIHKERYTRNAGLSEDARQSAIDLIHFEAYPDTYYVNLHVGINEAQRKGSYLFGYRVPEYNTNELGISDIIPAVQVRPTTLTGRYIKNGLEVQANPGRGFRKDDPLYVYFEIYNLAFSSEDLTNYTVQYTLEKHSEGDKRKLFRKKQSTALSISFEREGAERAPVEYGELNVSSIRKGSYYLTVTVTDNVANTSVSTHRVIELSK